MTRQARSGWLALLAIVCVLAVQAWRTRPLPLSAFDQPFYLGIAHDLLDAGRFTDGFMFAPPGPDGLRPSGMRFAPLYPALVAAAARLDPGLRRGMDCVVATNDRDAGCPSSAPSLRGLQLAELCAVFWLVWWLGGALGGPEVGWLALLLAAGAAPLLTASALTLMTEATCLLLSTASIAAGVAALRAQGAGRLRWAAVCGALLGLTILTRPAFLYVLPAALLAVVLFGRHRALLPAAWLAGAAALVLAPWMVRNAWVLGHVALTRGYDSHTLAQRIAFDTMNWREYAMSYVCWLPDGRAYGRALDGAAACDRFGWDADNSFYLIGLRHMLPETLQAAGGYPHHLAYLLHTYVLRMPVKHVLVSIPLALRGAYVAHWWGFFLMPLALWTTWRALRRHQENFASMLAIALPAWFMLAFNAAVAVNQVRYNLLLVPAYSVSGGLALAWLWRRYGARLPLSHRRMA